jgi:hypothetical protein
MSILAWPTGLRVPLWVFFGFVGFAVLYVVTGLVRDRRRRRRQRD